MFFDWTLKVRNCTKICRETFVLLVTIRILVAGQVKYNLRLIKTNYFHIFAGKFRILVTSLPMHQLN